MVSQMKIPLASPPPRPPHPLLSTLGQLKDTLFQGNWAEIINPTSWNDNHVPGSANNALY